MFVKSVAPEEVSVSTEMLNRQMCGHLVACGFFFFDEAPWPRGVPALHKQLVAGKMVQRCGRLGGAADYKSPTGKGFLMQHSALTTSIFCHGTVKDESPRGNSSP